MVDVLTIVFAFFLIYGAFASNTNATAISTFTYNTIPPYEAFGVKQLPNVYNKSAVDANEVAHGYTLVNVSSTNRGLTGILKLRGATNIYGYDFEILNLTVEYQSCKRLNVHIEPTNLTDVYVLPDNLVPKPKLEQESKEESSRTTLNFADSDLVFDYIEENFGFEISRASTGEVLFSTVGNPLVFSNQFIQLNTSLPQNHTIKGLGETFGGSINEPGSVRTLYANGASDPINGNLYSVHPVYYDQRYDSNTTHAVYWRSSAIQEVVIGEESLTWRALSGIIDLYFFSGPIPKDAVSQYVTTIGLPCMQPYWALGYHQSRWGYATLKELKTVVENFKKFDIPLETIWTDIDYMDNYKDYTTDPVRYPAAEFKDFLLELHNNSQHYVPNMDAGIYVPNPNNATDNDYPPFHQGNDSDIFIMNPDGSLYIGAMWPGYTAWPDYIKNESTTYIGNQLAAWYEEVAFDGLMTDENEISSFCVGSCGSGKISDNPVRRASTPAAEQAFPLGFNVTNATEYSAINASYYATAKLLSPSSTVSSLLSSSATTSLDGHNTLKPGKGNINYPPYAINNAQSDHDLATHAVAMNATHHDGTVMYDVRNIYGFLQNKAIYRGLVELHPNKRPFIIGRSTFAGSGKYVGTWGGDNVANYFSMYFSIPQAIAFGSFGVPFFGADVCGYGENTDMELCSRWMQLGSFLPFFRNHNEIGRISQEPYVWEAVANASRASIGVRYSLLPYYYTLMHEAHVTGLPYIRSLSFQFPYDKLLRGIDNQFFVGDALIVTPVLEPGVNYTKGVFPGVDNTTVYYDFYTRSRMNFTAGTNETLAASLGHIPLHIRGGYIIPTQKPGYTIAESRLNPFQLIVALDRHGSALGRLYLDDGESIDVDKSLMVKLAANDNKLVAIPVGEYNASQPLDTITILGIEAKPNSVKFNGASVDYTFNGTTVFITRLDKFTQSGAFAKRFEVEWD
ncbi:hypothetical protein KGF56_002478 [Candida oxycetoniae]|uniref:Glucoamylase 1 n=1 Tax=Candida oxycetoniae TaxID=497107 RepID=A0AAI9WY66_9ASCO|nr:uncharacterized protein KGF56_002478 [Candida oxycetoniae]KAI3404710.2 hypothetical protein KGF56_002478 [Candida oxycetoniae]